MQLALHVGLCLGRAALLAVRIRFPTPMMPPTRGGEGAVRLGRLRCTECIVCCIGNVMQNHGVKRQHNYNYDFFFNVDFESGRRDVYVTALSISKFFTSLPHTCFFC